MFPYKDLTVLTYP